MNINISKVSVSYAKALTSRVINDGETQRKSLPFLSIVSPRQGYYEISKNNEAPVIVRQGECFVVAADVFHTIVHHLEPGTKAMRPKWIFLNIKYLEHIDLTAKINAPIALYGSEGEKFVNYIDRMLALEDKEECMECAFERASIALEAFGELVKISEKIDLLKSTPIDSALEYINANLDKKIVIGDLAKMCHASRSSFFQKFLQITDVPPNEYIIQKRLTKAAGLLISENSTLADIAQKTGFYDEYHLSKTFKSKYGVSPKEYRRKIY